MLYDVFISYSREDSQQVDSLINYLRREIPGIKIWYDREGLETAEEFHDRIIEAIDESRAVIFACSANSMASRYCKKEVMYAKAIGKTVIPYLLPGMTLKGWLLFEFGNINCIRSTHIDEINRMVRDIKRWSEQDNSNCNSNNGGANSSNSGLQNIGSSNSLNSSFTSNSNNSNNTIESQLVFDPTTGEFKQRNNTFKGNGAGYINGHQYVDLGLPSGLLWATCNVGASKPEDYGNYYAWGELRTKSTYTQENCPCFGKDLQWLRSHGYIDAKGNLTSAHDVARQQWGGTWRMPTLNEFQELLNNTTSVKATVNGFKGYLLRSKRNNNSIFFPSPGIQIENDLEVPEDFGNYLSSTPHSEYSSDSYLLAFDNDFSGVCIADNRDYGRSVRAVSE